MHDDGRGEARPLRFRRKHARRRNGWLLWAAVAALLLLLAARYMLTPR